MLAEQLVDVTPTVTYIQGLVPLVIAFMVGLLVVGIAAAVVWVLLGALRN